MTTTTANVTSSEAQRSESPTTPAAPVSRAGPALPYAPTPRPYVPLRERINVRMIVFVLAIGVIVLMPAYVFFRDALTGGVTRSGDYHLVDLKAMGNFPFDQQSGKLENIPKEYRELDGKKVKLQGFMWGHRSAGDRGTEFQFVYNVNECCFKGPPQVQERVYAYAPKGRSFRIFSYQFAEITGTLHVRIVRDKEGAIYSIYDLDVEDTKPVES